MSQQHVVHVSWHVWMDMHNAYRYRTLPILQSKHLPQSWVKTHRQLAVVQELLLKRGPKEQKASCCYMHVSLSGMS